jgi:predicted ester cyclase
MTHHARYKIWVQFLLIALILGGLTYTAAAQDDMGESHKALIRQVYEEAFNGGDFAVIDANYAADYVNHGLGDDVDVEGFKAYIEELRAALPDFAATIEVLIAEGEWAATRVAYSGTFENEWVFEGEVIPPTGEPVEWTLNILHHFNEQGQLAEDFTAFDQLGLLIQMDASPLPNLITDLLEREVVHAAMEETVSEGLAETQAAAFRHVIDDAINNGDLTAIDTYMAEDYQLHEPLGDYNRQQFRDIIEGFRTIVPDLHVDIDALVIEGDWLASRLIYTGTFTEDVDAGVIFVEATNAPIRFIINVFVRFDTLGVPVEDFKEYNLYQSCKRES